MKIVLFTAVVLFAFSGCSTTSESVKINNIPPKTTSVKADAPGAPSYRGYPGARYYNNYYYDGRYYNGYYYNHIGNGPLTYQGSPEDIDNQIRRVD